MDKKPVLISVIIPVLNEQGIIEGCLQNLQFLRHRGHEIILVDGDSHDQTRALAKAYVDCILVSPPGRAKQMHLGAKAATNDIFLFLHIDTSLPSSADCVIHQAVNNAQDIWGRFDVKLSGTHPMFRVIETMMNIRSRFTGIATGDQAIFVQRGIYEEIGGISDIPIMEDIALSQSLKKYSKPVCLHERVTTSSRRWEQHGIFRTILLMWGLRFAYWLGIKPETLQRWY